MQHASKRMGREKFFALLEETMAQVQKKR